MDTEMTDQDFFARLKKLGFSDEFSQRVDLYVPKEIRRALADETLTAIACAWESAKAIRNTKATVIADKEGGAHDYLTLADLASHKTIFAQLKTSGFLENDEVLSEESENKPADILGASRLWIIDELDGTNNTHRGIDSLSANCVGYAEKGIMKSVAVCIPDSGSLMFAQKGLGTYLNGKKVKVTDDEKLEDTAVATDYYFNPQVISINLKVAQSLLAECTEGAFKFQALGSAVTSIFHVAHGGIGVYYHTGLSPWDNAAKLLVEEAGGHVTNLEGEEHTLLDRGIIIGKKGFVMDVARHTSGQYNNVPKTYKPK